jgi:ubiquitin carboxyl-terminal hydrolase 34
MTRLAFFSKLKIITDAFQIIDFLVVFPPQAQALELVRSKDSSEKDLFPLQRPYKALYSLNTLSLCLHEEAVEVRLIPVFLV